MAAVNTKNSSYTSKNSVVSTLVLRVKNLLNRSTTENTSTYYESEEYTNKVAQEQARKLVEATKVSVLRSF